MGAYMCVWEGNSGSMQVNKQKNFQKHIGIHDLALLIWLYLNEYIHINAIRKKAVVRFYMH